MILKLVRKIKGSTIGGIFLVVFGNMALLFSKMLVWLLAPRLLGVTDYGYYKMFTLYLVYAMLFHFGFPDGVLLLHAGQKYEDLDKTKLRRTSRFFILFQILVFLTIAGMAFCFLGGMERYIFCMIGIDAFFINVSTYYKFISQAVMRFRELTVRNVMQAVMQVTSLLVIMILSNWKAELANGYVYIFSVILVDAALMVYYVVTYRDITFGKAVSLRSQKADIRRYFSAGILLTAAFQVSHFVFVLDSQMVEILFNIEIYSLYAFSYSITGMISLVINAISTVMLPSLKRLEERNAVSKFSDIMAMISIVVFFLTAAYYPLVWFINWYLPDYAGALEYLKIILPGVAVSSCINLIIFTYYKVLNQLKYYFVISTIMLLTGMVLNYTGYYFFHTPKAFSVASIFTLLLWYLSAERYFVKKFQVKWVKNFLYICVEIVFLYFVNVWLEKEWEALLFYLCGCAVITLLFYGGKVKNKMDKAKSG